MSCGFFPALDKAGWREAPGWFEAVIPQPGSDSYRQVIRDCRFAGHPVTNVRSPRQGSAANPAGFMKSAGLCKKMAGGLI